MTNQSLRQRRCFIVLFSRKGKSCLVATQPFHVGKSIIGCVAVGDGAGAACGEEARALVRAVMRA